MPTLPPLRFILRIGLLTTRVLGALQKVPGESIAFATIAPRVYLRMADLESTGLLRTGSLARYRALFHLPPDTDTQALVALHRTRLDDLRLAVAILRCLGCSVSTAFAVYLVQAVVLGTVGATLGLLAALTGVALAFAGSAVLAVLVFKVPFHPPLGPAAAAVLGVTGLTVVTGLLASRGITTHPPLEILRGES